MRKERGKQIFSEKETRQHLIDLGKLHGFEGEVKQIFDKYDRLLRNCTNQIEKQAIAMEGVIAVHNLLGGYSDLEINGIKIRGKV